MKNVFAIIYEDVCKQISTPTFESIQKSYFRLPNVSRTKRKKKSHPK